MKYDRSDPFKADYKDLSDAEKTLFRAAVALINQTYAAHEGDGIPHWPAELRIQRVRRLAGVWEMTWHFSGPDGRATFEYITIEDKPAIKWRRIGTHRILDNP